MVEQHFGKDYAGIPPENYERFFVPEIGAPLASDLIQFAALSPGEQVLDVACGTGVVARLAAEQVGPTGSVAGLDSNPGMLAVANSAVPAGVDIQWYEASAEAVPLPDSTFDVVLCQMGLQFFADKHAALKEMYRVLVPGGRLVLNLPGPTPPLFTSLSEAFRNQINAESAEFVNQVFSLYDTEAIRDLISGAGFQNVAVQFSTRMLSLPSPREFLWHYVHSTPLAGVVRRANDEQLSSLEREVVTEWQKFVIDRDLMLQVRVIEAAGWA